MSAIPICPDAPSLLSSTINDVDTKKASLSASSAALSSSSLAAELSAAALRHASSTETARRTGTIAAIYREKVTWERFFQPYVYPLYPLADNVPRSLTIAQNNQSKAGAVWSAGIALSKYIEYRWARVTAAPASSDSKAGMIHAGAYALRDKHVLDLGSGTGIVGLVAAIACGGRTILTDLPDVLPFMQSNLTANASLLPFGGSDAKQCVVQSLSWGDGPELDAFMTARNDAPVDVVIGSDLVYEPQLAALLLTTLLRVCGPHTIGIYASDRRGRNGLPMFLAAMNQYFECNDIPSSQMDPMYCYDQIRLISFTRRVSPLPSSSTATTATAAAAAIATTATPVATIV